MSMFVQGASWTWDYFAANGSMYSTERYTVVAVHGTDVLLEIASDYSGHQSLVANTRVEVDVARCLAAYSNPAAKKPFSIKMFSRAANGSWSEYEAPSTLAFEEKFNCNPHVFTGAGGAYLTVYRDGYFQQKLWRRLTGSWFFLAGPFAAVAGEKDFETGYVFRLRH